MEGHAESCIVLEQRELSGDGNKKGSREIPSLKTAFLSLN